MLIMTQTPIARTRRLESQEDAGAKHIAFRHQLHFSDHVRCGCRQWHRNQDGNKVAAEDVYIVRDTNACPNKGGQGLVPGGGPNN